MDRRVAGSGDKCASAFLPRARTGEEARRVYASTVSLGSFPIPITFSQHEQPAGLFLRPAAVELCSGLVELGLDWLGVYHRTAPRQDVYNPTMNAALPRGDYGVAGFAPG